ncbi:hypothetical protein DICPUDRAFT_159678 [Dictyostelium purpureum]|uniref:Uncharacterized protein n=1 Tax=Dictyostelium purpureum TaxID=5786 RepID=F1A4Q3_DICPU|nr:uncharacterized protein DICPUDRAFT_159678 [Dictyostelium purpureum]EGC28825.1 hypothetical protein DICPUDRAFT_159678 [Dictyostelium purpureum]|eukprot:XP_003294646.1 hypothetical protein DICPUDRAFT_159678 [Dictyostelium purpureum]
MSSGSSGCDNKNSNSFLINNGIKITTKLYTTTFKTLNIGNIQETLDKFHSNRADHPKITYEAKKKYLEYSNIEDIEKLFRAISTYSAGIPFNKLSISFIWKKGLICHHRENFKNNSTKSNFSSNVSPVYNYTGLKEHQPKKEKE